MPTKGRLLKKIKVDLKQLIVHGNTADVSEDGIGDVLGVALSKLNEMDITSFAATDENIFADVYRQLIDMQEERSLNVYEAPLLNDLDELENYLIR